jgi:tape measure domain-containing protein
MPTSDMRVAITLIVKDLGSKAVDEFTRGFRRGMAGVQNDAGNAAAALRAGMTSISTQLATLQRLVIGYQAAVGALRAGSEIIRLADDYKSLNARLKLATGSMEAAGLAMHEVRRIANKNGQTLASVGELYARLAVAIRDMGGSQETAAKATEAVSLALRISNADTVAAASATLQLSQAFASGVLRGDEFNSVNEAAPRIMQAVAEHLGVTRGKLREMAEQGKLTSDVLSGALLGSLQKLREESKQLPDTLEQATVRMKNAWTEMVAKFDASTGSSARAAAGMNAVAKDMDGVLDTAKLLGEGVLVILAGRMLSAWRAAAAGAGALGMLGAAAGGAFRILGGWPALLLAVGVGLAKLGWSLGEYLAAETVAQRAREKSLAATGRLIGQYAEYAATVIKARADLDSLTTAELQSYRERLRGALAYYNALYEAEAKRGDRGDQVAKAAAKEQVQVYVAALAALRPVFDARLRLEKDHSSALKRTQEELTPQLKAALDAQTKAYQDAGKAAADIEKKKVEALKQQKAFEAELLAKPVGKKFDFGDFEDALYAARQAAQSGDADAISERIKLLREMLLKMRESGLETGVVLSGLAREVAGIENAGLDRAAEKAKAEQEAALNQLLQLQGIAKGLEAIKIGVDQDAAQAALKDTEAKLQAFADANPIIQRVIVQAQGQMLVDANAPAMQKKAAGGLISGPGSDTSDNLLAWLSPGEFVMRAAAVRRWGVDRLAAMNAMRFPAFAAGGLVGAGGSGRTVNVNLNLGGASYPLQAAPDVADGLERAIRTAALKRS